MSPLGNFAWGLDGKLRDNQSPKQASSTYLKYFFLHFLKLSSFNHYHMGFKRKLLKIIAHNNYK